MTRTLATLATCLLLTACGSSGEPAAESSDEASPSSSEPSTQRVTGTLLVDSIGAVRYDRAADECKVVGDGAEAIEDGVTILAPDGSKVAIGDVTGSRYDTYEDGGETYVDQTRCTFVWTAEEVPVQQGVYTAEVPDFDVSETFELGDTVELKADLGVR